MRTSAGIIIENNEGLILGCHATLKRFEKGTYDIPKGLIEKDETPYRTVLRECWEETGIDLSLCKLNELGEFDYLKDKRLYLFKTNLDIKESKLNTLNCISKFERNGKTIPEMNGYKLISKDQLDYFYPMLSKLLKRII